MDQELHQSSDNHFIPMTSVASGKGRELAPDVYYYTNQIVNVIFIGKPGDDSWVMIDAGMPVSGPELVAVAAERFGTGAKPSAILLTHGHFDHVGSIVHLIEQWNVPVYAHPLEMPFLTGAQDYPQPDPGVSGGLLAKISFIYPHKAIDITPFVLPLPEDGAVPFLPDWKWIHVPGHTPGQVAFFREHDRVLIASDAFITVRQDSLYKVLVQEEEVNGPPRYLTTDWDAARKSVTLLRDLKPRIAVTGHGAAMQDEALSSGLDLLVNEFKERALPEHGRYVDHD